MDIEHLFEAGLANLKWLDVDPHDLKNIPAEKPASAIRELEDAWAEAPAKTDLHLVPNYEIPGKFASSSKTSLDLTRDIVAFVKRDLMSGSSLKVAAENLKKTYPLEFIKKAEEPLREVFKEAGVLGNVYIDPSAFDTCKLGKDELSNRDKVAKFAMKMDKCAGCIKNEGNFCSLFRKDLVDNVPYDRVLPQYQRLLTARGIELDSTVKTAKQMLKVAFSSETPKASTSSAVVTNVERSYYIDRSLKETPAMAKFASAKVEPKKHPKLQKLASDGALAPRQNYVPVQSLVVKTAMDKKAYSKEAKEIRASALREMSFGLYGSQLLEKLKQQFTSDQLVKHASVLKSALEEQGLLGYVYVDPSLYGSRITGCKKASERLSSIESPVRYVFARGYCAGCQFNTNDNCGVFSKPIVNGLKFTDDGVQKYLDIMAKEGSLGPDEIKVAMQKELPRERLKTAVLLRKSSQVKTSKTASISNPVEEYGLTSSVDVMINEKSASDQLDISFSKDLLGDLDD